MLEMALSRVTIGMKGVTSQTSEGIIKVVE